MAATLTTTHFESPANADALVDPDWLEEHLDDPTLCLVEVDVNAVAYDEGHIDGAVLWNVYQDLKDADYHLVDQPVLEELMAQSGLTAEATVVFYGYAPALAFWLMKRYGHRDVRLLDYSRASWLRDNRRWTSDRPSPIRTGYRLPEPNDRIRADHRRVQRAIGAPASTLLDVRTEAEFRGERFWPSGGFDPDGRAGHIPTAVNVSLDGLYDEDGRFRSAPILAELFASAGLARGHAVITYCTIGARACTAWFALTYLLGHERVRVYDESWAEWGRLPTTPVD